MNIFAQMIDMHELHRPGDAALEVAKIDFADRQSGLRQRGQSRAASESIEQPHGSKLRVRMERNALTRVQQQLRISVRHRAERTQGADAHPCFGGCGGATENRQHALHLRALHNRMRYLREGIHHRKQVFPAAEEHPAVELVPISPPLLRHAVGKEAARDGLERITDSGCVLLRNLVVGMQAQLDILVPERDALAQHRVQRRRDGKRTRAARKLFSIARAGVCEDCPHDLPRVAAHVAVVMHQQLIQKAQCEQLVRAGHIGAVFFKQEQIGADAAEIFFVPRLLQQRLKRVAHRDGVHQVDVVAKRMVAKRADHLIL